MKRNVSYIGRNWLFTGWKISFSGKLFGHPFNQPRMESIALNLTFLIRFFCVCFVCESCYCAAIFYFIHKNSFLIFCTWFKFVSNQLLSDDLRSFTIFLLFHCFRWHRYRSFVIKVSATSNADHCEALFSKFLYFFDYKLK